MPLPVDIERRQDLVTGYFKEMYGARNPDITGRLTERLGPGFAAHTEQVQRYGITKIPKVFGPAELGAIRADLDRWEATKSWDSDRHMGFDGNSGEGYLPTSEAISRAVTHPAIHTLATAAMGQHPRLSFEKVTFTDSTKPYERRAFQWHHDGHSEIGLKSMVLLTDVPEDGQGMLYVPGSGRMLWDTTSSRETRFDPDFARQFDAFTCAGEAGDVFVFSNNGIHRGVRNEGPRRDVLFMNWQPGLGRNYPLPGLHPDVVAELSEYERAVFGVDGASASNTIGDFVGSNEAWRAMIEQLYGNYEVPEEPLRRIFTVGSVDTSIATKGEANRLVTPVGEPFADAAQVARIDQFKAETVDNLRALDTRLATVGSIEEAFAMHGEDLRTMVEKDLHGDLDLEIRMYHPFADQRRDNAITQTRDGKTEQVIDQVTAGMQAIDYQRFVETDVTDYESIADRTVRNKGEILMLTGDAQERMEADEVLSFTDELSTMIRRAYNPGFTRRTMLYTYLMNSTLSERYGGDERLPEPVRQQMREDTEQSLIAYAKLALMDKKSSGSSGGVLVSFT